MPNKTQSTSLGSSPMKNFFSPAEKQLGSNKADILEKQAQDYSFMW